MKSIIICSLLTLFIRVEAIGKYKGLEFIEPCSRKDPQLEQCLGRSINVLANHFKNGIPQLGYPVVEPIVLDQLQIQLGEGPNGYKAQFTDVEARGVSAVQVAGIRTLIKDDAIQLQFTFNIPKIRATAKYHSSGQLLLYKASGGGDYWGEYDGVKAKVFVMAEPYILNGRKHLKLQKVKIDFSVKDIKMGVENLQEGNATLQAALNLFINSYSQDLLKEMKPDIRKKLLQVMAVFIDNLFAKVPYDAFIID